MQNNIFMMSKIKKYIPEIIVIILVLGLICSNLYIYFKGKYEKEEILTVKDSLLIKMRNDSTAVKILEDANINCLNSTVAKIEYYENRIKSMNRQVSDHKLIIDRLQQQKNSIDKQIRDIDSTKMNRLELLNFINKKY